MTGSRCGFFFYKIWNVDTINWFSFIFFCWFSFFDFFNDIYGVMVVLGKKSE